MSNVTMVSQGKVLVQKCPMTTPSGLVLVGDDPERKAKVVAIGDGDQYFNTVLDPGVVVGDVVYLSNRNTPEGEITDGSGEKLFFFPQAAILGKAV